MGTWFIKDELHSFIIKCTAPVQGSYDFMKFEVFTWVREHVFLLNWRREMLEEIAELLRQMVDKLTGIETEIIDMNNEIRSIKGYGLNNTISDIAEKVDELKGDGLYNSISDVNSKLDDLIRDVGYIEMKVD